MPKVITKVAVRDVRQKDELIDEDGRLVWTAWADPVRYADGGVKILIQFKDGGIEARHWSDPTHELEVHRAV